MILLVGTIDGQRYAVLLFGRDQSPEHIEDTRARWEAWYPTVVFSVESDIGEDMLTYHEMSLRLGRG